MKVSSMLSVVFIHNKKPYHTIWLEPRRRGGLRSARTRTGLTPYERARRDHVPVSGPPPRTTPQRRGKEMVGSSEYRPSGGGALIIERKSRPLHQLCS